MNGFGLSEAYTLVIKTDNKQINKYISLCRSTNYGSYFEGSHQSFTIKKKKAGRRFALHRKLRKPVGVEEDNQPGKAFQAEGTDYAKVLMQEKA